MEDGSLRCDLNISIAPYSSAMNENSSSVLNIDSVEKNNIDAFLKYLPPGTGNRVEVKNLNSIRQGRSCSFDTSVSFITYENKVLCYHLLGTEFFDFHLSHCCNRI